MKTQVTARNGRSSGGRHRPAPSLSRIRSAVTNGSSVLVDVDHRSAWMRRLRDLIELQTSDLGGAHNVSQAEQVLVRRCAMLTLQLEMMEQRFAQNDGEASSRQLEAYQRTSNSLRRLLESLGLKRRARDVTPPTLEQYLGGADGD